MIKGLNKFSKGFTLIELLVVIAIIGILAGIVLASLGTARSGGKDSAVKEQLSGLRAQMEIFANGGSYASGCAAAQSAAILAGVNSSAGGGGVQTTMVVGVYNKVTCHDTPASGSTAWAAEGPLSASTSASPAMWCVDSTGASKSESAVMLATASACL